MKNIYYFLMIPLIIVSCNKRESSFDKDLKNGCWMFSNYTFKNNADYTVGFVKGAGVAKYFDYIFLGYADKNELKNTNLFWKIGSIPITNVELEEESNHKFFMVIILIMVMM